MTTKTLSSYKRHDRKADDTESVWHYFLIEIPSKQTAKCIECAKILKTHSGSTGGLLTHLETHKIFLRRNNDAAKDVDTASGVIGGCPTPSTSTAQTEHSQQVEQQHKKLKITDYFIDMEKNSLEAALSRMTSCDGLPFALFCTSVDLRAG